MQPWLIGAGLVIRVIDVAVTVIFMSGGARNVTPTAHME